MAGFGLQRFGTSPWGVGSPTSVPAQDRNVLRDTAGVGQGSRRIDPRTRDIVVAADGRAVGQNNARHLVQLALSTERFTSAVRELGQQIGAIETITADLEHRLLAEVTRAVQYLIDANVVAVLGVVKYRQGVRDRLNAGAVYSEIAFRDLTDGQEFQVSV